MTSSGTVRSESHQNEEGTIAQVGTGLTRVVVCVLGNARDEHLVIRRPASSRGGGQLGYPGGKQEPGESDIDTLIREAQEELGIAVVGHGHLGQWDLPEWGVTVAAYLATGRTENLNPSPDEVAEVLWLPPAQLATHQDALRSTQLIAGVLLAGAPVGTAPVGTAPVGTAPVGTAPVGTAPFGTAPVAHPSPASG